MAIGNYDIMTRRHSPDLRRDFENAVVQAIVE